MNDELILPVVFFRTLAGREPVREWLKSLSKADRKNIGEDIKMNPHTGSSLDDFLAEEEILEEVSARALKRLLALQLDEIMAESQMTKSGLAASLQTSRSQVDRLLDPDNTAVTLESLERLARAVGKQLRVEFA